MCPGFHAKPLRSERFTTSLRPFSLLDLRLGSSVPRRNFSLGCAAALAGFGPKVSLSHRIAMPWPVLADELDALARRLQRMSLVRSEQAYETRSEIVHAIRQSARRIREAAKPSGPSGPKQAGNTRGNAPAKGVTPGNARSVTPGTITDRNGNVIPVSFKRRRGTGRTVPKGYR